MKTVLITGASRGIGAETARLFAKENYKVFINYNKSEDCAVKLASEIGAEAVCADVSDRAAVAAMFEKTGGVDVLINNAGIAKQQLFSDVSEQEWDRMFDVNIKGMYNTSQMALPYMINKKCGRIINISSIWGIVGASCEVAYSASKSAVIGFTKALAKELGPSGITVNCVAPGVVDTDMNAMLDASVIEELKNETPLEKIGTVTDIANAILFLASDKAQFITGQVISPNGGMVIY